jgi:hypothetical protein
MTVYYQYDEDGNLLSTSVDERLASQGSGKLDPDHYLERGDTVGAYLAQRDMQNASFQNPTVHGPAQHGYGIPWNGHQEAYSNQHQSGLRHHHPHEQSESYSFQGAGPPAHAVPNAHVHLTLQAKQYRPCPDPEHIRHLHTLHSLLSWIHPERRMQALGGAAVDIVEQDTGTILAYNIPKKLLVLFLGRDVVSKFIMTVGVVDDDYSGIRHRIQKILIPRGISSKSAMRVLLSWMSRASRTPNVGHITQFNVPRSLFVACTLAQTLTLFGLHKDALRVDHTIAAENFKRPIFESELDALWNCLGPNNRYTYTTIKIVGERLRAYETGASKRFPNHKEMLDLLERRPALKALVRDLKYKETHRPLFSTEWCRSPNPGQHSERLFNGYPARGSIADPVPPRLGNNMELSQNKTNEEIGRPKTGGRKVAVLRIVTAPPKEVVVQESLNQEDEGA